LYNHGCGGGVGGVGCGGSDDCTIMAVVVVVLVKNATT
jgi:hypothetical protein